MKARVAGCVLLFGLLLLVGVTNAQSGDFNSTCTNCTGHSYTWCPFSGAATDADGSCENDPSGCTSSNITTQYACPAVSSEPPSSCFACIYATSNMNTWCSNTVDPISESVGTCLQDPSLCQSNRSLADFNLCPDLPLHTSANSAVSCLACTFNGSVFCPTPTVTGTAATGQETVGLCLQDASYCPSTSVAVSEPTTCSEFDSKHIVGYDSCMKCTLDGYNACRLSNGSFTCLNSSAECPPSSLYTEPSTCSDYDSKHVVGHDSCMKCTFDGYTACRLSNGSFTCLNSSAECPTSSLYTEPSTCSDYDSKHVVGHDSCMQCAFDGYTACRLNNGSFICLNSSVDCPTSNSYVNPSTCPDYESRIVDSPGCLHCTLSNLTYCQSADGSAVCLNSSSDCPSQRQINEAANCSDFSTGVLSGYSSCLSCGFSRNAFCMPNNGQNGLCLKNVADCPMEFRYEDVFACPDYASKSLSLSSCVDCVVNHKGGWCHNTSFGDDKSVCLNATYSSTCVKPFSYRSTGKNCTDNLLSTYGSCTSCTHKGNTWCQNEVTGESVCVANKSVCSQLDQTHSAKNCYDYADVSDCFQCVSSSFYWIKNSDTTTNNTAGVCSKDKNSLGINSIFDCPAVRITADSCLQCLESTEAGRSFQWCESISEETTDLCMDQAFDCLNGAEPITSKSGCAESRATCRECFSLDNTHWCQGSQNGTCTREYTCPPNTRWLLFEEQCNDGYGQFTVLTGLYAAAAVLGGLLASSFIAIWIIRKRRHSRMQEQLVHTTVEMPDIRLRYRQYEDQL